MEMNWEALGAIAILAVAISNLTLWNQLL